MKIRQRLLAIITKVTKESGFADDQILCEIAMDSVVFPELVFEIEKEFDINITNLDFEMTIAELVQSIEQQVAQKSKS